ncbi:MAG: hypothetical protein Q9217_004789 [Psora testacea]
MSGVAHTNLAEHLPLVASGKVREVYELSMSTLLFVATDRISAYDVVMKNTVDQKGAILTQLSEFWFNILQTEIPTLQTHFISSGLPSDLKQRLPSDLAIRLEPRSMVVKKLKVMPIESIVRGYITGSAWSSYRRDGTVCGLALPPGLKESQKLDQAIWTPSTKAGVGSKDENITPEEAVKVVGKDFARQVKDLSLQLYNKASAYTSERGIILADTKFEFGLDESTTPPSVVLIDEVLTPDSSRFWSAEKHEVGRSQDSFDKQYLRDWLVQTSQKGKEGVTMPDTIITNTLDRYKETAAQRNVHHQNAPKDLEPKSPMKTNQFKGQASCEAPRLL